MGELADWGKQNSKFLTIGDGEYLEGEFKGANIVPSNFDPTKHVVAYRIDDKIFNSGSRKLATAMDEVPVGAKIRITRTGNQSKTRYNVSVVG